MRETVINIALQPSRDSFEAKAWGLGGLGDRPGDVAQGSLPLFRQKCFDFFLILGKQI